MPKTSPAEIVSKIQQTCARGREAWKQGNIDQAEQDFLAARAEVSEPKPEFDYGQILSRGLVLFFRDTRQFDKAYQWLGVMRQAYAANENSDPDIAFLAATVHFESGRFDESFSL